MASLRPLAALTLLLLAPLRIVAGCTASVYAPFAGVSNPGGLPVGAPCTHSYCDSPRGEGERGISSPCIAVL